jgi:hypothetical protein
MSKETKIVSKVLVHEFENTSLTLLKDVCIKNNLIGLKVSSGNKSIGIDAVSNEFYDVLASNLDLGAIFLTEATDHNGISGIDLCARIHIQRPELPIFLRRVSRRELPKDVQNAIAGSYENNNIDELNDLISEYISGMFYPVELAQGFQEISTQIFEDLIPGVKVTTGYPYLVKDQLIFGELFTLIPIESDWCRGFMMLQTTENEIIDLIRSDCTSIKSTRPNRNEINSLLNEATNLIWGKAKSCYFASVEDLGDNRIHVPILVNHSQKNISFGSTEPQLCFKYVLHDPKHRFKEVTVYQRLVFNLSWSPEKFAENDKIVEHFVEGGELEMF